MAVKQNLVITQGTTYKMQITYEGSNPNPLTGYTARLQVRNKPGGSTLYCTLDETDGIEIDEDARLFLITFTDEVTWTFDRQMLYYDVFTESPGGEVTVLSFGKVLVNPAVTVHGG